MLSNNLRCPVRCRRHLVTKRLRRPQSSTVLLPPWTHRGTLKIYLINERSPHDPYHYADITLICIVIFVQNVRLATLSMLFARSRDHIVYRHNTSTFLPHDYPKSFANSMVSGQVSYVCNISCRSAKGNKIFNLVFRRKDCLETPSELELTKRNPFRALV